MQPLNPFTQTLHINPTKEDRKATNVPFIGVFAIIFFIWLCVIMKVVSDGESHSQSTFNNTNIIDDTNDNNNTNNIRSVVIEAIENIEENMDARLSWKLPFCMIASGFIAIIYTKILSEPKGRYIVNIGMIFLGLAIFFMIIFIFVLWVPTKSVKPDDSNTAKQQGLNEQIPAELIVYIQTVLIIFFIYLLLQAGKLIVSFLCVLNVGTGAVFEIIRDSCRAVICRPSVAIFACAMSVIIVRIIIFEVFILRRIVSSAQNDSSATVCIFIHMYGATALTLFFMNFTQMVICGCIIDWYWTKDPSSSPLTIKLSLERIFKYHMGTVAFASIPLLPHLWSLIQVCRCRDSDHDIIKKYDIFTRFFSQLHVTLHIIDFGMIQTSIYGYEYGTAIMAAHDLVAQNNHKINLAVAEISNTVVYIGSSLIAIPLQIENIHSSLYSLAIPFYIVFIIAMRALLVNKMIINYTSEALKEDHVSEQHMVL